MHSKHINAVLYVRYRAEENLSNRVFSCTRQLLELCSEFELYEKSVRSCAALRAMLHVETTKPCACSAIMAIVGLFSCSHCELFVESLSESSLFFGSFHDGLGWVVLAIRFGDGADHVLSQDAQAPSRCADGHAGWHAKNWQMRPAEKGMAGKEERGLSFDCEQS